MNASSVLGCSKLCAASQRACACVQALRSYTRPWRSSSFETAVAATHQVRSDLLARPCQIAGRFERGRWDRDRRQRAGHQLTQQQVGVAAV